MNKSVKNNAIPLIGLLSWTLAALFFLYEFFLRTFVGSLASEIMPDLHLSVVTFGVIGSAYYLTYGIMQVPVGILADKFGVKYILTFATLICSFATLLFTFAAGFKVAFIARVLMGFGSSFAFVSLLYTAVTWFPKKYFAFFAGTSQFIGTMGPLLAGGPLVLIIAANHGDWRTPLRYVGFFGLVLCCLIFIIVKNKRKREKDSIIMLKPSSGKKHDFKQLFLRKQTWFIALYSATNYAPIALLGAVWGTQYLQARGLSQHSAAFMVSVAWVGYAVGCPIVGFISDLIKRRRPILIACALLGTIISIAIIYLSTPFAWVYGVLFFLLGIASAGQNIGFAAITENVNEDLKASALGLNNGAVTTFDTFVPPIVGALIAHSAGANIHHLKPENFTAGFLIMPILYGLALLLGLLLIRETYCKPQKNLITLSRI